jgi:glutamate-5-semialdehyde dehydrogenase
MRLERLTAGMLIPWGGDQVAVVSEDLAAAFQPGDHLIVVQESGDLLRISAAAAALAGDAIARARAAVVDLAKVSDDAISAVFHGFAESLRDDAVWGRIEAANADDVARARANGRSTTRLAVSAAMRADMIAGLMAWRDAPPGRGRVLEHVDHLGWNVQLIAAPLGVVGFVFEGRPNVFADATGVIRSGNAAVFRIGADALATARAIAASALGPALAAAGLPGGAAVLLESADRSAGWAMFADPRLSLAVARGSGPAVRQLGAVARQTGTAASLHGTGGAWLVADTSADPARFTAAVVNSVDRKACNTLNVVCVVRARAAELVPVLIDALWSAGVAAGHGAKLHLSAADLHWVPERWLTSHVVARRADGDHEEAFVDAHDRLDLGLEWEWEATPELWLTIVEDIDEAIVLFNQHSPRFIASLIAEDAGAQSRFQDGVDAAFTGDGFTRWVDGQFALGRPELGLSNWRHGRLFGRGGILSGDGVYAVRTRMTQSDPALRR